MGVKLDIKNYRNYYKEWKMADRHKQKHMCTDSFLGP